MKTAVSLPTPLFRRAENLARREKLSRSALYQRALEAYLASQEPDVTAQIDAALKDIGEDRENEAWVRATTRTRLRKA